MNKSGPNKRETEYPRAAHYTSQPLDLSLGRQMGSRADEIEDAVQQNRIEREIDAIKRESIEELEQIQLEIPRADNDDVLPS